MAYNYFMSLTPEEIEQNYAKFCTLSEKLGTRAVDVKLLIEALGVRLAVAPASSRRDYHSAYQGGLVEHSLRVLGNAMRIVKTFDWDVSKESLILVCLFHDIGKCGNEESDLYVPQTDSWRAEKLGEFYTHSSAIQYMTVPDRSLYLLQRFGVKLTEEEWVAIKIHDGLYMDENKAYSMKEPRLATVIHMADVIATKPEKGVLS